MQLNESEHKGDDEEMEPPFPPRKQRLFSERGEYEDTAVSSVVPDEPPLKRTRVVANSKDLEPVSIGPVEKRECPELFKIAVMARDVSHYGLDGMASEVNLRNLVGRFVADFCVYAMLDAPLWSLSTLLVKAYIKNIQRINASTSALAQLPRSVVPMSVVAPLEWIVFPVHTMDQWGPLEITDALMTIALHWRKTVVFTDVHRKYIRAIEHALSQRLDDPWNTSDLAASLEILARLWGAEYIFTEELNFVNEPKKEDDEVAEFEQEMWQWVDSKLSQSRDAGKGRLGHQMYIAVAEARLAEAETYARMNRGATTTDAMDVFAKVRTHVQNTSLKARIDAFDLALGAGSAALFAVHSHLDAKMRFDWIGSCVVVDQDLMRDKIKERVQYRESPWLLLFGGSWYVVTGNVAIRQRSVVEAIYHWFVEQFHYCGDVNGIYFDAYTEKYDLWPLFDDPLFPFARVQQRIY